MTPRITLLCLTLVFAGLNAWSQTPTYKKMMYDTRYNFYTVVDSAEAYFETHGTGKGSGFKGFQRWKNENESKYSPTGNRMSVNHFIGSEAHHEIERNTAGLKSKMQMQAWVDQGPYDADNITRHYSPGIGRVETFYVDPTDSNRIFLGSRSGGFWKTTDGGITWKNTTDTLIACGVEWIAVNPQNKDEVLIAVQHGGNEYTYGIFRSLDGGETWNISNFNPQRLVWGGLGDNERIFKIAYHPRIQNRVYVCTTKGLYVSDDNLQRWTTALSSWVTDIEFHPTIDRIVYAYRYVTGDVNYVKVSRDTGYNFTNSGLISINNSKGFISVTPAMPDYIYFASSKGIWRSKNQGGSFQFLTNPNESCQGMAVSDQDTAHILYGYVDIQASEDGGQSFEKVTVWSRRDASYVHADVRTMECLNGTFYVGTDGYLCKSNNKGRTWTRLNNGTGIREFYSVGISQSELGIHMAGSQDNGTSILAEDTWIEWNGGDGMEAEIQPLNNQMMVGSWQFGWRNYTDDGGLSRRVLNNPEHVSSEAGWEAPLLLDNLDQMHLYHFGSSMYSSSDFGITWDSLGSPEDGILSRGANAMNNSNIFAVSQGNSLYLTTNRGTTWKNISAGLHSRSITSICFDPNDDSTLLVTYNFYGHDNRKIFVSHDLGATWENITYNLGKMPVRTAVIDHTSESNIYVGTEVGIYVMPMNGNVWLSYMEGLPNVTVKDLKINYGANALKAATWGRGLWENKLLNRSDYPAITSVAINDAPDTLRPKYTRPQYVKVNIEYANSLSAVYVLYGRAHDSLNNKIMLYQQPSKEWIASEPLPFYSTGTDVYFKVYAVGNKSDTSITYRFHYRIKPMGYCVGSGELASPMYISRVRLNTLDNTSGNDAYSDYTASSEVLYKGSEYSITVNIENYTVTDTAAAWIDHNQNGKFEELERIVLSPTSEQGILTGTINTDDILTSNAPLRLRIRTLLRTNGITACDTFAGEIEDYHIMVRSTSAVEQMQDDYPVLTIVPHPNAGTFELRSATEMSSVYIIDLQGRTVYSQNKIRTNQLNLNLILNAGTYFIKVQSKEGYQVKQLVIH